MAAEKYSEKLNGLITMQEAGLPVLPFYIIDRNKDLRVQLLNFLQDIGGEKFCVRVDEIFFDRGLPSITDATVADLERIQGMVEKAITFISHPGNIYRNMHTINILRDNTEIVLEAVGPGFITPDMDKKGLLHEQIVYDGSFKQLSREVLVTDIQYKKDIETKLKGKETLHKSNNSHLLKHTSYVPLSDEEIGYIKCVYPTLQEVAKSLGYKNFVASLSFIELDNDPEPIFWDIFKVR
jgi:hypothetical protein